MFPYAGGVVAGEHDGAGAREVEVSICYDCLEEAEWCVDAAVDFFDGVRGAAFGEADGCFIGVEVDFVVFVGADEFDFVFPLWFPFDGEGCVFHGSEGFTEWEVVCVICELSRYTEVDGVDCWLWCRCWFCLVCVAVWRGWCCVFHACGCCVHCVGDCL